MQFDFGANCTPWKMCYLLHNALEAVPVTAIRHLDPVTDLERVSFLNKFAWLRLSSLFCTLGCLVMFEMKPFDGVSNNLQCSCTLACMPLDLTYNVLNFPFVGIHSCLIFIFNAVLKLLQTICEISLDNCEFGFFISKGCFYPPRTLLCNSRLILPLFGPLKLHLQLLLRGHGLLLQCHQGTLVFIQQLLCSRNQFVWQIESTGSLNRMGLTDQIANQLKCWAPMLLLHCCHICARVLQSPIL
mmetsp:Transcript_69504/g.137470  ORF Transcript_69504/g.137470 Transcript_69504/m.137470 type:complete len:243 (+) Transcript_69504:221-949(+)